MNSGRVSRFCSTCDTRLKFDTAPGVAKPKHEKPKTEVSVVQVPLAPPMDTSYIG